MSVEGSLTLDDFLVSLSNRQTENFSRISEFLECLLEKTETLENSLNEIKIKIERLEQTSSKDADKENFLSSSESSNTSSKIDELTDHQKFEEKTLNHQVFPNPILGKLDIYCFDCKKTFVRGSGHFSRHVRETPCRPYQCHCGKLFKKKSSLTVHQSTHSTASHSCSCGSVFRCEQYLKNHKRRKLCKAVSKKKPNNHLSSVTSSENIDEANDSAEENPMHFLLLNLHEME